MLDSNAIEMPVLEKPNIMVPGELMERILNILGDAPARVAGTLFQDIIDQMKVVNVMPEQEPKPEVVD